MYFCHLVNVNVLFGVEQLLRGRLRAAVRQEVLERCLSIGETMEGVGIEGRRGGREGGRERGREGGREGGEEGREGRRRGREKRMEMKQAY